MSGAVPLNTVVVVDLDKFKESVGEMKSMAETLSEAVGDENKEKSAAGGFRNASRSAFSFMYSLRLMNNIYRNLIQSVEELAQTRGITDEATGSLLALNNSVHNLWTSFLEGVLSSTTVQSVLRGITSVIESMIPSAKSLGTAFDGLVSDNMPAIQEFAHIFVDVFAGIAKAVTHVLNIWELFRGTVIAGIGLVVEGLSKLIDLAALVMNKLGATETAEKVFQITDKMKEFAEKTKAIGLEGVDRANAELAKLAEKFDKIDNKANEVHDWIDRTAKFITTTTDRVRQGMPADDKWSKEDFPLHSIWGVGGFFDPTAGTEMKKEALQGISDFISAIDHNIAAGLERMGNMFARFALKVQTEGNTAMASFYNSLSNLFNGMGALTLMVEESFGKSAKAQEIAHKVSMGMLAVQSTAQGMHAFAEAQKAFAGGNFSVPDVASGVANIAAGTAYMATAVLAGANAAGALGSSVAAATSLSAVTSTEAATPVTTETGVEQDRTQINIIIQGNIIGNEQYIAEDLIPALRQLVAKQDVVLISSSAQQAQQVGSGIPITG